jgi:hypothetical protein
MASSACIQVVVVGSNGERYACRPAGGIRYSASSVGVSDLDFEIWHMRFFYIVTEQITHSAAFMEGRPGMKSM